MGNNIQYFSIEMGYLISQKMYLISFFLLFFYNKKQIVAYYLVTYRNCWWSGCCSGSSDKNVFPFFSTWIYFEDLF